MDNFPLAIKATLDFLVRRLADENNCEYVDLDDVSSIEVALQSSKPALAWSLLSIAPTPRDPMWQVEFLVGGKTSHDPAQYDSMRLVSLVTQLFRVHETFDVLDYSGVDVPDTVLGDLQVETVGILPADGDQTSSRRPVRVQCNALRWLEARYGAPVGG